MNTTNYEAVLNTLSTSDTTFTSLSSGTTTFNISNRNINIPLNTFMTIEGDSNSRIVQFKIPRYFDGVDLYEKLIRICFENALHDSDYEYIDKKSTTIDTLIFTWTLSSKISIKAGNVKIKAEFYEIDEKDALIYRWQTAPTIFPVAPTFQVLNNAIECDYSRVANFLSNNATNLTVDINSTKEPIYVTTDRELIIPDSLPTELIQLDTRSTIVPFVMPRYYDNVDISSKTILIAFMRPDNKSDWSPISNLVVSEDTVSFSWLVTSSATYACGTLVFCVNVVGYNDKTEPYFLNTKTAKFVVKEGLKMASMAQEPEPSVLNDYIIEMDSRIKKVPTLVDDKFTKLAASVQQSTEIIDARCGTASLKDRLNIIDTTISNNINTIDKKFTSSLNTVDTQLSKLTNEKATKTEIDIERKRIDKIITSAGDYYINCNSSDFGALLVVSTVATTGQININKVSPKLNTYTPTVGDYVRLISNGIMAETNDIRLGIDGTTYSSAGEAVRQQIFNSKYISKALDSTIGLKLAGEDLTSKLTTTNMLNTTYSNGTYTISTGGWFFPSIAHNMETHTVIIKISDVSKLSFRLVNSLAGTSSDFVNLKPNIVQNEGYSVAIIESETLNTSYPYLQIRVDNRNGSSNVIIYEIHISIGICFPKLYEMQNKIEAPITINKLSNELIDCIENGSKYDIDVVEYLMGSIHNSAGTNTNHSVLTSTNTAYSKNVYKVRSGDTIYSNNSSYTFLIIRYSNGSYGQYTGHASFLNTSYTFTEDDEVVFEIRKSDNSAITNVDILDGVLTLSKEVFKNNYKTAYVDNLVGNDNYNGSMSKPFKSIQHAINCGFTTLIVTPSTYHENVTISNLDRIKIVAKDVAFNAKNTIERTPVIIDGGTSLTLTNYNGNVLYCPYTATSSDIIHQTFIAKSIPLDDGTSTRSVGYNITIWEKTNGVLDKKLVPVLTLDNCTSVRGTWAYDGTNIYVNPSADITNASYVLVSGDVNYSLDISYCKQVVLENIKCINSRYECMRITYCNDIKLTNCEASYSAQGNGFSLDYSNGNLHNCKANKNRNDGFNIHGFGNTNFYDCYGSYNYDDGISHHDGCTGFIKGGEWSYNGKGGISSPTYGAYIDIDGVYCHHNQYGLYSVSDKLTRRKCNGKIFGSVCVNNTDSDIFISYSDMLLYNTKYTTKYVSSDGILTEL